MTPQARFAEEHNVHIDEVARFAKLGAKYAMMGEHECNGDPHPGNPDPNNKNLNARLWGEDQEEVAEKMTDLAAKWGFHHLDFGVGFYPTLQKSESDTHGTVMFPYDN